MHPRQVTMLPCLDNIAEFKDDRSSLEYTEYMITQMELAPIYRYIENDGSILVALDLLKAFLAKRWQRISNTNLAYQVAKDEPANILCINLARFITFKEQHLEKIAKASLDHLLMPALIPILGKKGNAHLSKRIFNSLDSILENLKADNSQESFGFAKDALRDQIAQCPNKQAMRTLISYIDSTKQKIPHHELHLLTELTMRSALLLQRPDYENNYLSYIHVSARLNKAPWGKQVALAALAILGVAIAVAGVMMMTALNPLAGLVALRSLQTTVAGVAMIALGGCSILAAVKISGQHQSQYYSLSKSAVSFFNINSVKACNAVLEVKQESSDTNRFKLL